MTKEEIIAGNKLIAEFMGYTERVIVNKGDSKIYPEWSCDRVAKPNSPKEWIDINNLKYNSDWNWLMPVVEKVESLKGFYRFRIQGSEVCVYNTDIHYSYYKQGPGCNAESKLDAVFKAVVEFIKWYNQQLSERGNDGSEHVAVAE